LGRGGRQFESGHPDWEKVSCEARDFFIFGQKRKNVFPEARKKLCFCDEKRKLRLARRLFRITRADPNPTDKKGLLHEVFLFYQIPLTLCNLQFTVERVWMT
jgi:hypothetical protein